MNPSFEQALIEVWRQTLIENAKVVERGTEHSPVRRTPKRGLRQVDFVLDGNQIRGLEQNPDTKSRWAQMARSGKKVMQFLSEGRYVANVVDGKVSRGVEAAPCQTVRASFEMALAQPLRPRSEICTPKPVGPGSRLFVGDNWASSDVNPSPIEVRKLLQLLHQN